MEHIGKYKGYDVSARDNLAAFSDADQISDWAVEAMKWGVAYNLIKGTDKGLEPMLLSDRAQTATFFMRLCKCFIK